MSSCYYANRPGETELSLQVVCLVLGLWGRVLLKFGFTHYESAYTCMPLRHILSAG